MIASGQPIPHAQSVAAEAIGRRWPMASAETAERLARTSTVVETPRGTLLAQGERQPRVALVMSGTIVATWSAPDGRIAQGRIVHVRSSGAGQLIGLTTLSGGSVGPGIDALTRVTMATWSSPEFRAITDSDPPVSLDLLDQLVVTIRFLNHLIQLRTFTTAASRLAGLLLQNESFCFSLDAPVVARGQLAALAGVTPQMVSRILRRWETAMIVRRVGLSGLELLDRAALEAAAAPLKDFPAPDLTRRSADDDLEYAALRLAPPGGEPFSRRPTRSAG
jgi:CRP-like cAMP-binding protein